MLSIGDWDGCVYDKPLDIDIIGMVKNKKKRDILLMKLHGYTEREIADKHGYTVGTVHNTVRRVIANLRSEFLKDFNVLGIELPKSNHSNLFM